MTACRVSSHVQRVALRAARYWSVVCGTILKSSEICTSSESVDCIVCAAFAGGVSNSPAERPSLAIMPTTPIAPSANPTVRSRYSSGAKRRIVNSFVSCLRANADLTDAGLQECERSNHKTIRYKDPFSYEGLWKWFLSPMRCGEAFFVGGRPFVTSRRRGLFAEAARASAMRTALADPL